MYHTNILFKSKGRLRLIPSTLTKKRDQKHRAMKKYINLYAFVAWQTDFLDRPKFL